MQWPTAKRSQSLGIYLALTIGGVGICAWQWGEHRRFEEAAAQALINRGRDITSTLGIVVGSQRRFGNLVAKDRIESALQGLIHPGELESIAILGATGEPIASAGRPVEVTPEMLRSRGVYWREHELTIMNLMDLGVSGGPGVAEDNSLPAALVVSDPRMGKAFRPSQKRMSGSRPTPGANSPGESGAAPATGPGGRVPYSRPAWMDKEEYDALIKKQGVHSLVISLSTDEMQNAIRSDLWLRTTVSLLAAAAAIISALAWRNVRKSADLQIRLVKAGEANTHLTEMNFAAAGLAHETRNPLNLIRGIAQMIAMQPETAPKLKERAATIIEEADRVTVQLNEFINYSKPREAHPAPVDLPRLVSDVTRTLQADLEEKQIRLQLTETPLSIQADEPLFRQALFNLLLNAVQAVGVGGQIWVDWSVVSAREAVFEIRDDGPGVPEANRTSIFKPYVTMREKGVGLGLAIVQQITAAHGWEIVCDANQPRGAVFRIRHLKVASAPGA